MNLPAIYEKYKDGLLIVRDWLGSTEQPVLQGVAQKRANTCLQCPHNRPSALTTHAGAMLKRVMEIKNHAQMRVNGEKQLGQCDICLCDNRTKIWTPIDHILNHTDANELAQYPGHCWIWSESKL